MPKKTPLTIMEKLVKIQSKLKSPKGQWNDFSKYHYRNCEDILSAVKPLAAAEGLAVIVSDEIINVESRFYVKATAKITDGENEITSTGFAREEAVKKGMDGSQITGASSSYARKYALNGLFAIDDSKDSDTTNAGATPPLPPPPPQKKKLTEKVIRAKAEYFTAEIEKGVSATKIYENISAKYILDETAKIALNEICESANHSLAPKK